jgi:hypothetical protein
MRSNETKIKEVRADRESGERMLSRVDEILTRLEEDNAFLISIQKEIIEMKELASKLEAKHQL